MTNTSETNVRELSPEDLERVSGAGIKVPQVTGLKPPGSDAGLDFPPGPSANATCGLIGL